MSCKWVFYLWLDLKFHHNWVVYLCFRTCFAWCWCCWQVVLYPWYLTLHTWWLWSEPHAVVCWPFYCPEHFTLNFSRGEHLRHQLFCFSMREMLASLKYPTILKCTKQNFLVFYCGTTKIVSQCHHATSFCSDIVSVMLFPLVTCALFCLEVWLMWHSVVAPHFFLTSRWFEWLWHIRAASVPLPKLLRLFNNVDL